MRSVPKLHVSAWSLGQWKKEYLQALGEVEIDGQSRSAAEVEQENRQLRRELEAVRRQRDLLKKAIAICSQDGLAQPDHSGEPHRKGERPRGIR